MTAKQGEATKAEFNMLKALWKLKEGTVADVKRVSAELFGTDPAYTTVMTLLGRLEAKQLVRVDKTRQPFVYKPKRSEAVVVRSRLKDFIDTVFEGRASALMLQLVEDEALSSEDLKRIEAKIAAATATKETRACKP
jgi:BlaI family penicillinase repressor